MLNGLYDSLETSGAEEKEKTAVCSDTVNMEWADVNRPRLQEVSELAETQKAGQTQSIQTGLPQSKTVSTRRCLLLSPLFASSQVS